MKTLFSRSPFEHLFSGIACGPAEWTVSTELWPSRSNTRYEWHATDDNTSQLEVQLPGIPREAIELYVENSALTLVADGAHKNSRAQSKTQQKWSWTLEAIHDSENITAELSCGILTLTVPTLQAKKPERKTIEVK